jgi:hypothetical protein
VVSISSHLSVITKTFSSSFYSSTRTTSSGVVSTSDDLTSANSGVISYSSSKSSFKGLETDGVSPSIISRSSAISYYSERGGGSQ